MQIRDQDLVIITTRKNVFGNVNTRFRTLNEAIARTDVRRRLKPGKKGNPSRMERTIFVLEMPTGFGMGPPCKSSDGSTVHLGKSICPDENYLEAFVRTVTLAGEGPRAIVIFAVFKRSLSYKAKKRLKEQGIILLPMLATDNNAQAELTRAIEQKEKATKRA